MLYVHKLADLNRKSAEIESISFVRELSQYASFPITQAMLYERLSEYLASHDEIEDMKLSLTLIEPAVQQLTALFLAKNELHEPINIYRAAQGLRQLPTALTNNISYAEEMLALQSELLEKATALINSIPSLQSNEERKQLNSEMSGLFERILRNQDFYFWHSDLVNESHTSITEGLIGSLDKGYLFHITLEEELRKADFPTIKLRIPQDKLAEAQDIRNRVATIAHGIRQAYNVNVKMVTLAVVLYSCIKWAMNQQR